MERYCIVVKRIEYEQKTYKRQERKMKIGDLVWVDGTNREVSGVVIQVIGKGFCKILLQNGQTDWFNQRFVEVILESR